MKDLFEYQVIQFMNDFLMRKLPSSFDKAYRLNCEIQATHHTRQHNLIFIERCNSTVASKLPYYTFPILWNKWAKTLPASKCEVKSQMRRTILAAYAESVKCANDHCHCANPYYRLVNLTVVHGSSVMAAGLSLRDFSAWYAIYFAVFTDTNARTL